MKVFIIGANKSGKTTLVNLLKEQINGVVDEEKETYRDLLDLAMGYYRNRTDIKDDLTKLLPNSFSISANPAYFPLIPVLHKIYPSASFIFVCRDGRQQVAQSMRLKLYRRNDPYKEMRLKMKWYHSRFTKCCHYWNRVNEIMLNDLKELNLTYIKVMFESLIAGHAKESLSAFLGVPMIHLKPPNITIDQRDIDKWTTRQHKTFTTICGSTMDRLGYMP